MVFRFMIMLFVCVSFRLMVVVFVCMIMIMLLHALDYLFRLDRITQHLKEVDDNHVFIRRT